MEIRQVVRKTIDLKPDPNQPRKTLDMKRIQNLASTYNSQGIINPIEIDEHNIIVTGELRWRAAMMSRITDIKCELLLNVSEHERFVRQLVENLHHNNLTSIEQENAVKKLWESEEYRNHDELGGSIGLSRISITEILGAEKTRRFLEQEKVSTEDISSRTMKNIGRLTQADQKSVAIKVIKKEIPPSKIVKAVKIIKALPSDLKKEVLKLDSEITLEDANSIAGIPKPELRKEAVEFIKKQKKEEAPINIIDLDHSVIKQFINIYKQVTMKMTKRLVDSYNEQTKAQLLKIMNGTLMHLQKELNVKKMKVMKPAKLDFF